MLAAEPDALATADAGAWVLATARIEAVAPLRESNARLSQSFQRRDRHDLAEKNGRLDSSP